MGEAPFPTCNNAEKYKAVFNELRLKCTTMSSREESSECLASHIRGNNYLSCEPTLTFGSFCAHHLRCHVNKTKTPTETAKVKLAADKESQKWMEAAQLQEHLALNIVHASTHQPQQTPSRTRKRKRDASATSVSLPHLTKRQFSTYMRLLRDPENVSLDTVLHNRQELQDFAVQCVCAQYMGKYLNARQRTQELTKILPSYTIKQLQDFVVSSAAVTAVEADSIVTRDTEKQ